MRDLGPKTLDEALAAALYYEKASVCFNLKGVFQEGHGVYALQSVYSTLLTRDWHSQSRWRGTGVGDVGVMGMGSLRETEKKGRETGYPRGWGPGEIEINFATLHNFSQ